jgi:hypothetical protein
MKKKKKSDGQLLWWRFRHWFHHHCPQCCPAPSEEKGEIKVMFVEQSSHDPVPFSVAISGIKDADGNELPREEVKVEVTTSDSSVLTADYDESTDKGEIQFGTAGESLFTINVTDADDPDDLLATYQMGFKLISSGDPASVTSVSVTFEGITEVPAEPPPVVDNTLPGGQGGTPDQSLPGEQPVIDNTLPQPEGGRPVIDNTLPGDLPQRGTKPSPKRR